MLKKTVAESLSESLTISLSEVLPNVLPSIIAKETNRQFAPIEQNIKHTVEEANTPVRQAMAQLEARVQAVEETTNADMGGSSSRFPQGSDEYEALYSNIEAVREQASAVKKKLADLKSSPVGSLDGQSTPGRPAWGPRTPAGSPSGSPPPGSPAANSFCSPPLLQRL